MKALFVHDARYIKKAGEIYTELEFSYNSWQPYLARFDHLTVVGRSYIPEPSIFVQAETYNKCSGPRVSFSLYPSLTNFKNALFKHRAVDAGIMADCAGADVIILRGVQENAALAFKAAKKLKKPVLLEGTGCMWSNTWHHSFLGKLYAPIRYRRARRVFDGADGVLYVTQKFLQKRYPSRGLTAGISDAKLRVPDEAVMQTRLTRIQDDTNPKLWRIGIIGPLDHKQKGIDLALRALAQWHRRTGQNFLLHLLGRGRGGILKIQAQRLGIGKNVIFDGVMPHERVPEWLQQLDLYLQPSRTEGMPRAVLEAMTQALPVIVSDAGDMPSIIDPQFVHARGDVKALSGMIYLMLSDTALRAAQAERNFKLIETDFHPDILKQKQDSFWQDFMTTIMLRSSTGGQELSQKTPAAG